MFNPEILKQLQELNIYTIKDTLKEAETIYPLVKLPLEIGIPYCLCKINNDNAFDKWYSKLPNIGYISVNGIKYIILYVAKENRKLFDFVTRNRNRPNPEGEYELTGLLTLEYTDNIKIFHRPKPKKKQEETTTSETTTALAPLCGLFADTVDSKPNNLFYIEYAMKHQSFYLYATPLNNNKRFQNFKYFKLYCTLLFIAEKSSIIKHKRNECYISNDDLVAVIPDYFRNKGTKATIGNSLLHLACKAGILEKYCTENGYWKLTYTKAFMENLSTTPYIKVPLGLVNDVTIYNYKFILYFIVRNFSNNPKHPYFVNLRAKELLRLSEIKIRTLSNAAERLNTYFAILAKYHGVRPSIAYDNDNNVTEDDIRNNNLLSFRLYKFQQPKVTDEGISFGEDEEPGENEKIETSSSTSSSSDDLDEPTPPQPFEQTDAFRKANAELDKRKNPRV